MSYTRSRSRGRQDRSPSSGQFKRSRREQDRSRSPSSRWSTRSRSRSPLERHYRRRDTTPEPELGQGPEAMDPLEVENAWLEYMMEDSDGLDSKKARVKMDFSCEVCNVNVSSMHALQIHFAGAKHQKKLRQGGLTTDLKDINKDDMDPATKEKIFRCSVCDVVLSGHEIKVHVKGPRHQTAMEDAGIESTDVFVEVNPGTHQSASSNTIKTYSTKHEHHCSLCGVTLHHWDIFQKHLQGKRHQKLLKWNEPDEEVIAESAGQQQFWCNICGIFCTNKDSLDGHLAGKKHFKMLKSKGIPLPTAETQESHAKPPPSSSQGPSQAKQSRGTVEAKVSSSRRRSRSRSPGATTSRERRRSHSRSRSPVTASRDRWRSRSRSPVTASRGRWRSRSRSPVTASRGRWRSRSRSQNRWRSRSRSYSPATVTSRRRGRSHSRSHSPTTTTSHERQWSYSHSQSPPITTSRERRRSRSHSRSPATTTSRERRRSRSRSPATTTSHEKRRSHSRSPATTTSHEREWSYSRSQSREKRRSRSRSPDRLRSRSRSPVAASSRNKRRSRSPGTATSREKRKSHSGSPKHEKSKHRSRHSHKERKHSRSEKKSSRKASRSQTRKKEPTPKTPPSPGTPLTGEANVSPQTKVGSQQTERETRLRSRKQEAENDTQRERTRGKLYRNSQEEERLANEVPMLRDKAEESQSQKEGNGDVDEGTPCQSPQREGSTPPPMPQAVVQPQLMMVPQLPGAVQPATSQPMAQPQFAVQQSPLALALYQFAQQTSTMAMLGPGFQQMTPMAFLQPPVQGTDGTALQQMALYQNALNLGFSQQTMGMGLPQSQTPGCLQPAVVPQMVPQAIANPQIAAGGQQQLMNFQQQGVSMPVPQTQQPMPTMAASQLQIPAMAMSQQQMPATQPQMPTMVTSQPQMPAIAAMSQQQMPATQPQMPTMATSQPQMPAMATTHPKSSVAMPQPLPALAPAQPMSAMAMSQPLTSAAPQAVPTAAMPHVQPMPSFQPTAQVAVSPAVLLPLPAPKLPTTPLGATVNQLEVEKSLEEEEAPSTPVMDERILPEPHSQETDSTLPWECTAQQSVTDRSREKKVAQPAVQLDSKKRSEKLVAEVIEQQIRCVLCKKIFPSNKTQKHLITMEHINAVIKNPGIRIHEILIKI